MLIYIYIFKRGEIHKGQGRIEVTEKEAFIAQDKRMEPRFLTIFLVALSFPPFVHSLVRHYQFNVSILTRLNIIKYLCYDIGLNNFK